MNKNLTINWKGKFGKRGLTEDACEFLIKQSIKLKKPSLEKDSEDLKKEYHAYMMNNKIFNLNDEVSFVGKYLKVLV